MFGNILNVEKIKNEKNLDLSLERKFKNNNSSYNQLIDKQTLFEIKSYESNCRDLINKNYYGFTNSDCLAQMLSIKSVPSFSNKCINIYDLKEKITLVRSGNSCCSDAVESFIVHANIVNLPAREVHTKTHSFAEYYDSKVKKWKLIDVSYKKIFIDKNKKIISTYDAFNSTPYNDFIVHSFAKDHEKYSLSEFIPETKDSFLAYKLGNDILATYNFEANLPSFFPYFFKNFLSLSFGINPTYIIITKNYLFWLYKIIFFVILFFILLLEFYLLTNFIKIKLDK